ncbi:MAG: twitching motility protein PilT [Acidobacteria bacterium RIFCSPLOWO2_02_FULL_61_28]|nr:MAG: twitching motility protein PilT [Acidobacteria bacterium RIFCSPLOWO2_02_FULL_61_28]
MKAVLVDSDILIEVFRARDRAILVRWGKLSQSDTMVLCSPVNVAELWGGVLSHEQSSLNDLFAAMTCIPIDAEVGRRAGAYLKQYSKSHNVKLGDALIAATASIHNVELWTRNRRHYPMKDVAFY